MGNPLKVGIVGLGGAGRAHAMRFERNPCAEVVAFYDPKQENLSQTLADLRLSNVKVVTDSWSTFLETPQMDVVSICSPDYAHAHQTIDCLEKGFHVLCEKPMATSTANAYQMAETAVRMDRKLMVHHQMRYVPTFLESKKYLLSGELGNAFIVEADYYHDMRKRASLYDDWRINPATVQNIVFGAACHPLDLMQWLLRDIITEVFSYSSHQAFIEYPDVDTVCSVLRFGSGVIGRMTMTIGCCRSQYNPLIVLGSKGTLVNGMLLRSDYASKMLYHPKQNMKRSNRLVGKLVSRSGDAIHYPYNHYEHEYACECLIDEFLQCVIQDSDPPIKPEESLDAIRVCEAVVQSYTTGLPVRIDRCEVRG